MSPPYPSIYECLYVYVCVSKFRCVGSPESPIVVKSFFYFIISKETCYNCSTVQCTDVRRTLLQSLPGRQYKVLI